VRIVKILFLILALISPFILHIWKKNMVNALNIKISSLTVEVQDQKRSIMILNSKWRRETLPGIIEKRAREILNMRYPEKKEIFKIENFAIMGNRDEK
jgi:hypothetical protein